MKNTFLVIFLTFISLVIFAGFGLNIYSLVRLDQLAQEVNQLQQLTNSPSSNQPDDSLVASQAVRPTTEPTGSTFLATTVPAEQGIKQALAAKYDKDVAQTMIEISENTGTYAKGLVKFAGDISGGWFLAVREDSWKIVADGNGTVMCADIAPYDFPVEMVPDCWDEAAMELVAR
ncbi:MAG: hypothetical protein GF381_01930 [Candidatus Pacebacteria bacterium]|nr:hypothetical protein [Candidatus Paceibacterota bacterium]